MKTSVIRYRVADFLRESAPFDGMTLEDLLEFAGSGRVLFHEDGVLLFQKGETRDGVIWVIQQGRIEVLDEESSVEELKDVMGPGDILGLRSHAADTVYRRTARTATETILYAFDANTFDRLVSRYPDAVRFLTAHVSASTDHTKALRLPEARDPLLSELEKSSWLRRSAIPAESEHLLQRRFVTCDPTLPIVNAARLMIDEQCDPLVIVTPDAMPLGLIDSRTLIDRVGAGRISSEVPVEAFMDRNFASVAPGMGIAEHFLEMLRSRVSSLVITADGSARSRVLGILRDTDLELMCGRNPVTILKAIRASKSIRELAFLWRRAEAFLEENWAGPSVVDWFAEVMSEFRRALIERLIEVSSVELSRTGRSIPSIPYCWILFGEAARREPLTGFCDIGIAYADGSGDSAEEAARYFSTFLQKVTAKLEACGLHARETIAPSARSGQARSISQWKELFRDRIRDPIGSQVYATREGFDFSLVQGESVLVGQLREAILEEQERNEAFLAVMANDTLAKLPPLTFFQGMALEMDGRLNQVLDIEKTVLNPITDASRVLAFSNRDMSTANTIERLVRLGRGASRPYRSIFSSGRCLADRLLPPGANTDSQCRQGHRAHAPFGVGTFDQA